MNLSNVPAELKSCRQWVVWKYEETGRSKPSKVPYSAVSGYRADPTENGRWAWCDFERAYHYGTINSFNGVGFVFTGTGYVGIDLDATNDPVLIAAHNRLVSSFNTYTEVSPSGMGRHLIVRGSIPHAIKDSIRCIEVYQTDRYFTVTGEVFEAIKPIGLCTEQLRDLMSELAPLNHPIIGSATVAVSQYNDNEIIAKASVAANADKFLALHSGSIQAHNNDNSAADQAYVNILAFYTQDHEQIARIWRASGLRRDKLNRKDYVSRTIQKAMDQQIPVINFDGLVQKLNGEHTHQEKGINSSAALPVSPASDCLTVSQWQSPPSNAPPSSFARPPGLIGEIAEFIYAAAPYPVPEIALAGAIGLLSGICGRAYNISKTGCNLYTVLLAKSGRGKEAAANGINQVMKLVVQQEPSANLFIGPNYFGSGQALLKAFGGPVPSFLSIIGECGHWIDELCDPRANANNKHLRKDFLDLYNKSGSNDVLNPMVYSDQLKNTKIISSPSLSILGETTPEMFYNSIDEHSITIGLIPRFLLIEYTGERPQRNYNSLYANPSSELITRLAQLCSISLQLNNKNAVTHVLSNSVASQMFLDFSEEIDARIRKESSNSLIEIWNRVVVKTLKLSALLAIGVNPVNPVITAVEFEWSRKLTVLGAQRVQSKFESGETGNVVSASRQELAFKQLLDDYLKMSADKLAVYRVNPAMYAAHCIPLHYIRTRLQRVACFRQDKDTNRSIDTVIKSFITNGYIVEKVQIEPKTNKKTTFYDLSY